MEYNKESFRDILKTSEQPSPVVVVDIVQNARKAHDVFAGFLVGA